MRQLPTGTVTFLFTDIEGSTRLLDELGDAYAAALTEHRRLLRAAFAAHAGVEVDTQGDAFFVVFTRAGDALQAARDAQAALAPGPIRVRMGLHTGEPVVTEEGYVGLDVHRAARIAAAAHGGQVVVSEATRNLGAEELRELGEHRLKDLAEPVALFQLGDRDFPPLKTISNTNLPRPASSFVGRNREVDDVRRLVGEGARLLTLTGPGGSGKTRLALEVAAELVPLFKGGTFWIGLAPVRDPKLVAGTVAATLGAKGALAEHIGERELLLLLDNLEQVIEVALDLVALVEACPNLHVLVTSRERLRVRGEVEYPVLPLADADAVDLFYARAEIEQDESVAKLCRALDNLPLALELAAARTTVLSPRQIVQRLSERLDLFKGGRDVDPRQQTLRATIKWSYDLLSAAERRVFARLAVFRRGCTLDAAHDVARADLDTLQSLVDKGLVRHTDERFWMLETIREFAAERLRDSGELTNTTERHSDYFRAFAEAADEDLHGPRQSETMGLVEIDLDNMRGAFQFNLERGAYDDALAIVVSLERFWSARGRSAEVLALAEPALEAAGDGVSLGLRARASWIAGFQAARAGEFERPARLYKEALAAYRELGRGDKAVPCLCELAWIHQEHGLEAEAVGFAADAVALAHELNDPDALSASAQCLGTLAHCRADYAQAAELFEECLRLRRESGYLPGIASSLYNLGNAARGLGDAERAEAAFRESHNVATRAGHAVIVGCSAINLGHLMLARSEPVRARPLLRQGLDVLGPMENPAWTASALDLAAAITAVEGDYSTAVRLWGSEDVLLEGGGTPLLPYEVRTREGLEPRARAALGLSDFEAALQEGRRLTSAQALELALAVATMVRA